MSCGGCKKKQKCTDGCGGCKQCTETCNCKLEGNGEANVYMKDAQTRVVDVPHDPIVVSTDNSVSVDVSTESYQDGTRPVYDLSVECCDSKVAVCAGDANPGPLRDKLDVIAPLTIDVDCGDKITIGLDQNGLTFPEDEDEKVAWVAGCDGKYLDDLVGLQDQFQWYNGPDPLTAGPVTNDCDKRYLGRNCSDANKCKPRVKQAGKLRLEQNVVEQQTAGPTGIGQEKFYIFLNGVTSTGNLSGVTAEFVNVNYSEELTMGGITYEDGGIKLCRDGYYRIGNTGALEVTRGCNGIRTIVFAREPGQPIQPLLESRYSPPSDPGVPVAGTRPPRNYLTTAGGGTGLNRGFDYLERAEFGGTDIYKLRKDTIIFFGVKVSSIIDDPEYDTSRPAEFAILGTNAIGSGPSGDIGMQFHIESIDDVCNATAFENCGTC